MALWTVAWSPRTRQHCIHHHPGPCNRWFIGHSFCPTSKGEGDSWKQAEQFTITMQTEEFHCRWLCPLSGTGQRLYFRLYLGTNLFLMCYNLALELPPPCHEEVAALSSGYTVVRSGSPDFSQLQQRWRTRVLVLLTTLARSLQIVLGVGNHLYKSTRAPLTNDCVQVSIRCFHDVQSHWHSRK